MCTLFDFIRYLLVTHLILFVLFGVSWYTLSALEGKQYTQKIFQKQDWLWVLNSNNTLCTLQFVQCNVTFQMLFMETIKCLLFRRRSLYIYGILLELRWLISHSMHTCIENGLIFYNHFESIWIHHISNQWWAKFDRFFNLFLWKIHCNTQYTKSIIWYQNFTNKAENWSGVPAKHRGGYRFFSRSFLF